MLFLYSNSQTIRCKHNIVVTHYRLCTCMYHSANWTLLPNAIYTNITNVIYYSLDSFKKLGARTPWKWRSSAEAYCSNKQNAIVYVLSAFSWLSNNVSLAKRSTHTIVIVLTESVHCVTDLACALHSTKLQSVQPNDWRVQFSWPTCYGSLHRPAEFHLPLVKTAGDFR
jgi:hypothetical protein